MSPFSLLQVPLEIQFQGPLTGEAPLADEAPLAGEGPQAEVVILAPLPPPRLQPQSRSPHIQPLWTSFSYAF